MPEGALPILLENSPLLFRRRRSGDTINDIAGIAIR